MKCPKCRNEIKICIGRVNCPYCGMKNQVCEHNLKQIGHHLICKSCGKSMRISLFAEKMPEHEALEEINKIILLRSENELDELEGI